MSAEPFQAIKVDLPLPSNKRKAVMRDKVFAMLESLEVAEMREVNRGRRAANAYVYRFKLTSEKVFTVRASDRPGWSRIWRVK
jgi:hypothetical protein